MAVTANQIVKRREDCRNALPVAASTRLYEGTLAFVNSSGFAAAVTASGVNAFAGISVNDVDNSSGSAGDLSAEFYTDGVFDLVGSGFTQADVGKDVFASDNYTITLTGAGNTRIGTVARYVSATVLAVALDVSWPLKGAALTAANAGALNTGDATSDTVIGNIRTRVGEIETRLKAIGIIA